MKTIKKLLSQKQKQFSSQKEKEIDEKTIFHIARRVITEEYGKRGSENISPIFYKDKKLFLSPRSSLWASEIMLERTHLCKQINKTIGTEAVREIKIKTT
jgi:predicted nucleic acid-binding Zn ribbon protein